MSEFPENIKSALKLMYFSIFLDLIYSLFHYMIDDFSFVGFSIDLILSMFFLRGVFIASNFWRCFYGFYFAFGLGLMMLFWYIDFSDFLTKFGDLFTNEVFLSLPDDKQVIFNFLKKYFSQEFGGILTKTFRFDFFYSVFSFFVSFVIAYKLVSKESNTYFIN